MRRTSCVVALALLCAVPVAGQVPDTSRAPSDRQLRQWATWAASDAHALQREIAQLAERANAIREAVHTRITQDSLHALPAAPLPVDSTPAPAPVPPDPSPLPAVLFQDGFDTGVRAEPVGGAGWRRSGAGSLAPSAGRGGGHALEFRWPATPAGVSGNNPPLQEERFQVPRVREAWFEWWVLLPKNWNHRREDPLGTTDNNKFFALWADQYATNGHAQLVLEFNADAEHYGQTSAVKSVFRNEQGIVENDRAFRKAPIIVPEQIGVWTRYRVHVRLSSGPGKKDGTARLWRDNTLVWDTGNFEWWQEGGTNHFANGYLFGAQNSGYDQETTVYLDDFKIHHSNPGW
jgi:hypothetical protein